MSSFSPDDGQDQPRCAYEEAVATSQILSLLQPWDPRIVGTLPLGLALLHSDIDVVCCASRHDALFKRLWAAFSHLEDFASYRHVDAPQALVTRFTHRGWPFEVYAAPAAVDDQWGWRHFVVERRLLAMGGQALADLIRSLRREGLKTEPAFARALGLAGDPYEAMAALYDAPEAELAQVLGRLRP